MVRVGRAGHTSPTLNFGIVGLGGGASDMIPAFVQHPHINITAAADVDAGQLEKFRREFHGETYRSAEALCTSQNVDVVYIATPNQFHTAHALSALERHKHVLVEKPMCLRLEDADTMIQAAERNGVQLAVNVKHSFEPRIQKVRDLVRSGELGKLRMINYWYYSDWLYRPRTTEELNPALGGGVTWRQGPHQFDILRTIGGGLVRSVRAMTGLWDETRPVVGCHAAYLEFEDGVAATAVYTGYDHFHSRELTFGAAEGVTTENASKHAQARRRLRQVGTKDAEVALKQAQRYGGSSRLAQAAGGTTGRSSLWVLGGPLIISFQHGDVRLTPNGLMVYGDEEQWEIPVRTDEDGRHGIVRQVYDALVNDRPPLADGHWGKATLEVLLAVLASGQERKEVFLSHQRAMAD
ncbi:MAG: Gfo/Idh/MocA family oxidoreductase [Candidatus Tectomicrobia bacterium]